MKLEWGKKVTCPTCSKRLYDMMRTTIECPYCGSKFEDAVDMKLKKKTTSTIEESLKNHIDFELAEESLSVDESDTVVLEEEEIDSDIDVIKIKELDD